MKRHQSSSGEEDPDVIDLTLDDNPTVIDLTLDDNRPVPRSRPPPISRRRTTVIPRPRPEPNNGLWVLTNKDLVREMIRYQPGSAIHEIAGHIRDFQYTFATVCRKGNFNTLLKLIRDDRVPNPLTMMGWWNVVCALMDQAFVPSRTSQVGTLEILREVFRDGRFRKDDNYVTRANSLEALQFIHEKGYKVRPSVEHAFLYGDFRMFEYVEENKLQKDASYPFQLSGIQDRWGTFDLTGVRYIGREQGFKILVHHVIYRMGDTECPLNFLDSTACLCLFLLATEDETKYLISQMYDASEKKEEQKEADINVAPVVNVQLFKYMGMIDGLRNRRDPVSTGNVYLETIVDGLKEGHLGLFSRVC